MRRPALGLFILLSSLSSSLAQVPATKEVPLNIRLSEQDVNEQADWFFANYGPPVARCLLNSPFSSRDRPPACNEPVEREKVIAETHRAIEQEKTAFFMVPRTWADVVKERPKFVWIPTWALPYSGSIEALQKAAEARRPLECKRFSARLNECIAAVVTSTIRNPIFMVPNQGFGFSVCQVFFTREGSSLPGLGETDCEPYMMRFGPNSYVRVASVGPPRTGAIDSPSDRPNRTVVVPGFRDRALVFEYHFKSTVSEELQSPSRGSEYINQLVEVSRKAPLSLEIDQGDADNVIVAWSDKRYSSQFRLWERINLVLTTRSEAPTSGELKIRTVARPRITVSEQNVGEPQYWHEPKESLNGQYESMIATQVIGGAKSLCDGYARTIGQSAFTYNAGPVVLLNCEHPVP